jgi:hypothetical protein
MRRRRLDTKLATISTAQKVNLSAVVATSQAQGDVFYASSATNIARLGAGTSGQFLKTQGASANPVWSDVTIPVGATQTEMEAVTSNTAMATPLNMKWHPGIAKAWGKFNGSGTPAFDSSYNFDSSITDNGDGDYTLSFTTDFSSANGVAVATAKINGTANGVFSTVQAIAAGTVNLKFLNQSDAAVDVNPAFVVAYGDQA